MRLNIHRSNSIERAFISLQPKCFFKSTHWATSQVLDDQVVRNKVRPLDHLNSHREGFYLSSNFIWCSVEIRNICRTKLKPCPKKGTQQVCILHAISNFKGEWKLCLPTPVKSHHPFEVFFPSPAEWYLKTFLSYWHLQYQLFEMVVCVFSFQTSALSSHSLSRNVLCNLG